MAVLLPVDPGLAHVLARALGENDPGLAGTPPGAMLRAPLTYTRATVEHFDRDGELRAVVPGGVPVGGSPDRLHAEQHFVHHRDLVAGEMLTCVSRPGEVWRRDGSRGGLEFSEVVTDFLGADGSPAVTARRVGVRLLGPRPAAAPAPASAPSPGSRADTRLEQVAPGALWTHSGLHACVLTPAVTRADVARYAGASGDVNLVHVDDAVAAAAGHSSVIAHGMYVLGLTGTFLSRLVGDGRVRRLGARFRAPVLIGDPLVCTVTPLDATRPDATRPDATRLSFTTTGRDGTVVLSGDTEVSPPPETRSTHDL